MCTVALRPEPCDTTSSRNSLFTIHGVKQTLGRGIDGRGIDTQGYGIGMSLAGPWGGGAGASLVNRSAIANVNLCVDRAL